MDGSIFILCFLYIMVASFLIDRKKLRHEKKGTLALYASICCITLVIFFSRIMHWNIPMPSRFFIHTVSPWVSNLIGL
ncbi:hypothetical protein [Paenibacillus sp. SI8]|uniref:hypothetical protein n=1 Tax=unclassified Paenibacillus TaxID=185978 RepID=UPI0034652F71